MGEKVQRGTGIYIMRQTSGCLDLSIAAPKCSNRTISFDSTRRLRFRPGRPPPYSDRSSRDKPQKTMTPIAAITNNSSSVTGAMVLKSFISCTFTTFRDAIVVNPSCRDTTVPKEHEPLMNRA